MPNDQVHEQSPFQLSRRRTAARRDHLGSLEPPADTGRPIPASAAAWVPRPPRPRHRADAGRGVSGASLVMSLGPVNGQPLPPAGPEEEGVAELVALAYELLDAHADTARLYADGSG